MENDSTSGEREREREREKRVTKVDTLEIIRLANM